MSPAETGSAKEFTFQAAKQAILQYQPASNWVTSISEPSRRLTIGFGFDLGRPDASARLRGIGLDIDAVRGGREPISDAGMHRLFEEDLTAAVALVRQRIPRFADLRPEVQWGLLEIIIWLGPEGSESVFSDIEQLSLPLTHEQLAPRGWFDRLSDAGSSEGGVAAVVSPRRTARAAHDRRLDDDVLRRWAQEIARTRAQAGERYETATGGRFRALPVEVQAVFTQVARDQGSRASRFWSAVADHRWWDAQYVLRGLERPLQPQAHYDNEAGVLERAIRGGLLPGTAPPPVPAPGLKRNADLSAQRCQIRFESFGLAAELMSDDGGLLSAALQMLPPGWRESADEPIVRFGLWEDGSITVDGVETHREGDRGTSLLRLASVIRHRLAIEAPAHVFIHAGVVEVDGCGILLPGPSDSGKTTLVAALVGMGATYLSDEYAAVDARGLIHPFAKPMSIQIGHGCGDLVSRPPSQVAGRPVRSGLIVLTSYRCGSEWRPSSLPTSEGAFAVLQNTVAARRRPGSALRAASRVARDAVVLSGERGEATDAARALLRTVDVGTRSE